MPRLPQGSLIQCRVDGEMYSQLLALQKSSGGSMSEVIRTLLATSLGTPADVAAVEQALWSVRARLKSALGQVGPEITALVKAQLDAEFSE